MENLSYGSLIVLSALRANVEGESESADGETWGSVYLDNARPPGWSAHVFAGHLSALERVDLYRPMEDSGDAFGYVLIDDGV